MVGYVMWLANTLAPATANGVTGTAACGKIAMGVTMGYMLVMML
jgi:hypothetical protein